MHWLRSSASLLLFGLLSGCVATPQEAVQSAPAPVRPAPAVEATDCNCDKVHRIALLLPLSGQHQALGREALNGAMVAFYELYSPLNLELKPYDTQGTPTGARVATHHALEEGADVFIGPLFAENVQAAADIIRPEGLTLLALSNDKRIAQDNVKVLGGLLEEEVRALVEIVLRRNRQNVLLFAPNNAYGVRLRDEFQNLLQPHYHVAFQTALFAPTASADGLTKHVSASSGFEDRHAELQGILDAYDRMWRETGDSSQALTQTVEALGLDARWQEAFTPDCIYEELAETQEDDELADGALPSQLTESPQAVEGIETPLEPQAPDLPEAGLQTALDEALDEAEDIPEGPPMMAAYQYIKVCKRVRDKQETSNFQQPSSTSLSETGVPSPVAADPLGRGLEDTAAASWGGNFSKPDGEDEEPFAEDGADASLQSLPGDDLPAMANGSDIVLEPDPAEIAAREAALREQAAREADVRHEAALEDARFALLTDFAQCITYLSQQEYEEQTGVETLLRRFAKREVLGPSRLDAIVLPLANDQLRFVSSLFDYYHVGSEHSLILGTSLWDRANDLSDEQSLRGAKWVSNVQAHSASGAVRYKTYFDQEPSFISALAYDAVMMALHDTRRADTGMSAPGNLSFVIGESGTLRLLDDGTNERLVQVKEIAANGEVVTRALSEFLVKRPKPAFANGQAEEASRLNADEMLKRMCVGMR